MAYAAAGKRVLITGASSGLGAALASGSWPRGARWSGLIARRADRLAEVLADCRRSSPDSAMWVADLADTPAVGELARGGPGDDLGGIDVLINNAAIPKRRPVTELRPDEVEDVMRVNFFAPMRHDAGAAAADAGARLRRDRQRVQCRWPARNHPRNRLLCKQIRAVRLERGDGRRPVRHRRLGEADRAGSGRHRDLGSAGQRGTPLPGAQSPGRRGGRGHHRGPGQRSIRALRART